MIRINVSIQNAFGHWVGFMDAEPDTTRKDAEEAVEALIAQSNRIERLAIKQEDGTQVSFNKNILENAVISFLVTEIDDV